MLSEHQTEMLSILDGCGGTNADSKKGVLSDYP